MCNNMTRRVLPYSVIWSMKANCCETLRHLRERRRNLLWLADSNVCFMVLCISSPSYRKPLFGLIACASRAAVRGKQGRCRKITWWWKKERKTQREELEGSILVHIPEAPLEGAVTLTVVSLSRSTTVKGPDCEHWRLRPVHAAPLPDTSLSSAACGFETSPRFVGHHELHPGKSIALEAQTQSTMTNHTEIISTSRMEHFFQLCNILTTSLNTPVFEFSFKLHAIVSAKDACTLELSVSEFSFVPDVVVGRDRGGGCHL